MKRRKFKKDAQTPPDHPFLRIVDAEWTKDPENETGEPTTRHDSKTNVRIAWEICGRQTDPAEKEAWLMFFRTLRGDRERRGRKVDIGDDR